MDITLSVDDEVVREAQRRADVLGTSIDQLLREYLEQFAGKHDRRADAEELRRLSLLANGDSRGWKFNRDEIHER